MLNKIGVIVPVRDGGVGRAERLKGMIDSWEEQSEGYSDLHIIIDDDEVNIFDWLESDKRIKSVTVQSKDNTLMQKINTIALDIAENYEYVAFSADDIRYVTSWEIPFVNYLSSVPYGVVYGNDTIHGENLGTHPCVSSNLITTLGFFGCPAVAHNFFDNYWMSIGSVTGNIKYIPMAIMRHIHPMGGKTHYDSLNIKVQNLMESDQKNFIKYMEENFENDIKKVESLND
jgi:hypothetical protein